MDTLATVESMNCPIIDYSQLEIKRKIGDGSIGQVNHLLEKVDVGCVLGMRGATVAGGGEGSTGQVSR